MTWLMSARPPNTTHSNDASIFYPTRLGARYGMIPGTQFPSSVAYNIPSTTMSGNSRPHLPPPSHLEPSFVPQSPQVRPQYSDLPTRTPYPPYPRQPAYEHASSQEHRAITQAPAALNRSPYSSGFPHPPLYPQKVSYQSTNPGTLYEALSPVEYANHRPPPESSLFTEGGYTTSSPYPMAGLQHYQSPTSSYHSSATSSSGRATGPMHFAKPRLSPQASPHMSNM